jgi:hypothetical protein
MVFVFVLPSLTVCDYRVYVVVELRRKLIADLMKLFDDLISAHYLLLFLLFIRFFAAGEG